MVLLHVLTLNQKWLTLNINYIYIKFTIQCDKQTEMLFFKEVMTITELLQKLLVSPNKRLHLSIQRKEKKEKNFKEKKKKIYRMFIVRPFQAHNTSYDESFQLTGWRNVV